MARPFTAGTTTIGTIWGSRGDNSSGIDAAPQRGRILFQLANYTSTS
jgi:hypothetical protein